METKDLKKVDSKKLLKELGKNNVKMRYNDRKKVEIISKTKHYNLGMILTPHVTWADELIKLKIAKEI